VTYLTATLAFTLGWAIHAMLAGRMERQRQRLILDWGACHRLLDHLQIAVEHESLLPRVRRLADYLAASSGWPAGEPDPPPTPLDELTLPDELPPMPPFRV